MVDTQDASTLTDVCTSEHLPEVELVSLVTELLPNYKLRADTITDFTHYNHQDWGIHTPLVKAEDLQLSNQQIEEVFKYFILCSDRVTQMTKAYDDIEAVTHLLEEKERDLELAARIGQSLLEQNKQLVAKCDQLERDLLQYHEQTAQLRHDLSQKEQLLQLLSSEDQLDSREQSPVIETGNSKYLELVQKKLSHLDEENTLLRSELANLRDVTQEIEEKEQRLARDCVVQLNEAQKRIRELQAEADKKGIELFKCQEESANLLHQLVNGQQKVKELTIENLDLKETLKTSQDVQKEISTELFELQEKYKECRDLLDSTKYEVEQLKKKASPRVVTNRMYSTPLLLPPRDSLAAELDSLHSDDREQRRRKDSRSMETAQYVRKLCSKPPSLASSISSTGRPQTKHGQNPLLATPIPGSCPPPKVTRSNMSTHAANTMSLKSGAMSSSFYDEIERHRSVLGKPGIPGSKDLDAALKRLSLRRKNEESERAYRERTESENSTASVDDLASMDWSESSSTPTLRSPSPESVQSSELSGYGSASSFGFRMPERLQIVKPMEGSATLHHWQRLATPNMAGLLEEREGVQIKHEQPLIDDGRSEYSLMDPEEDALPGKGFDNTSSTFTFTDARVLHPNMSGFSSTRVTSSMTTTSTSVTSSHERPCLSATSTFSVSLGLATILQERGISAAVGRYSLGTGVAPVRSGCMVTESVHTVSRGKLTKPEYSIPSTNINVTMSP